MNTPLKTVRPVQKFVDAKSISSWAKTAVNYLSRAGILYGDTQQRFNPKSSTTRAEATALFSRYLNAAQLPKRKLSNYLPDTSCILHAGGLADGVMYSNSKEALSQSYAAGARLIEIDFNYTSDGYLACIHDWHNRFAPEIKPNVAPSLNSFLSMKIFNRFTPMWLGSVAEFMNEHSDVYIVTDIKEQNVRAATEIKKAYPHLMDRFIIQVYSEQEYHAIKKLGFDHIIFSLYKLTWAEKTDFDHLVSFAKKNKILAYTFDYTLLSVSGYYERISKAGVPLFVHTINTASMQKDYYKMGIYGIYSDMLLK